MGTGQLTIDLDALIANWQALNAFSDDRVETAAVVKADGYGLGAGRVAKALARAGARRFFVAVAEEGAKVREALGPGVEINVFGGHMRGDTDMIGDMNLTPMINASKDSPTQIKKPITNIPTEKFAAASEMFEQSP